MATLTVRGIDEDLKAKLRMRAARHGRSMEAEARWILRSALTGAAPQRGLGSRIHRRFAAIGGAPELSQPPRTDPPRAAELPE